MRYYISDLHFFHQALNQHMDKRGFDSVEMMHQYMISKWNAKVRKNDDVVILGDFSIGKGKETNEILEQLNGELYLIQGNHDKYLQDKSFHAERFHWIDSYREVNDEKRKVILCHYPVFCYNGQFHKDKNGNPKAYMLYGHVHDTFDEYLVNKFLQETRESKRKSRENEELISVSCNMINCFCMFSDYEPLTLDEWILLDEKRRSENILTK